MKTPTLLIFSLISSSFPLIAQNLPPPSREENTEVPPALEAPVKFPDEGSQEQWFQEQIDLRHDTEEERQKDREQRLQEERREMWKRQQEEQRKKDEERRRLEQKQREEQQEELRERRRREDRLRYEENLRRHGKPL